MARARVVFSPMPKLQQPLKVLRQRYSQQVNRGRELLARPAARPQDFSHLVDDAATWDHDNSLLMQATFEGAAEPYDMLPPPPTHGKLDEGLHVLRAGIAASLRQLENSEAKLATAKRGCLGVFLLLSLTR